MYHTDDSNFCLAKPSPKKLEGFQILKGYLYPDVYDDRLKIKNSKFKLELQFKQGDIVEAYVAWVYI